MALLSLQNKKVIILKEDKKGILYFIKDSNKTYYKKLISRFKKNKNILVMRI